MYRRSAPWLGGLMLVGLAAFLVVFGRTALSEPATAALLVGSAVAAFLLICGGTVDSVTIGSRTVPWNVPLGAADGLLALVLVLSSVSTLGTGDSEVLLFAAVASVGGAALAWMGVQTARDSRHVDLEATPSRARLAGIVGLAGASMVGGVIVATVV
ncbi:hypothetical protein [Natronolimnohabitans innermongolicus]|nr:hypothetical protein [Natronolimnohabitans innermongolicus]